MGTIVRISDRSMLDEAFEIRRRVFVEEQKVPEDLELDAYDDALQTAHVLARDENGNAVGTARLRPYNDTGSGKVERVAVLSSHRGTGLGRLLMEYMEAEAVRLGFHEIVLNAQIQARGFYERLGYIADGSPFFEAGIQHIAMRKTLSRSG